ncbi:hypothetical protein B0H12DRAFT_1082739 [Mycena haematopus]|nr:hypothetical protein B0H12DRAFT_1082739 [Mycena haematopus]
MRDSEEERDSEEAERMVIPEDEDDGLILLTADNLNGEPEAEICENSEIREKRYSNMFNDMFYRPPELDSLCVWDITRLYVKEKKPTSKTQRKTYLRFKSGHPQYNTHCLKKLDSPVIPVLMGYRVPRNDSASDELKYAVIILSLFKPWSNIKLSPLKSADTNWLEELANLKPQLSPEHSRVVLNMQLLYQTRDAKFDYAAKRGKRLAELKKMAKNTGIGDEEGVTDLGQEMRTTWSKQALHPKTFLKEKDSLIKGRLRAAENSDTPGSLHYIG